MCAWHVIQAQNLTLSCEAHASRPAIRPSSGPSTAHVLDRQRLRRSHFTCCGSCCPRLSVSQMPNGIPLRMRRPHGFNGLSSCSMCFSLSIRCCPLHRQCEEKVVPFAPWFLAEPQSPNRGPVQDGDGQRLRRCIGPDDWTLSLAAILCVALCRNRTMRPYLLCFFLWL